MTDIHHMKLSELREYAQGLANKYNVCFKKTVHGKNKSELFKFIEKVENNPESFKQVSLEQKSKQELIKIIENHPEYNESFHKKSKKALIQFIQSKQIIPQDDDKSDAKEEINLKDDGEISPIHFDDILESPNIDKLKEAITKCFSDKPFDDETYKEIQKSIFSQSDDS